MKLTLRQYVVLLIMLAVVAVVATRAHAQKITQSNDNNLQTSGDIAGDKSKVFAFSHSLGDVDINEGQNCMGSEAWSTIIVGRQDNNLNPWCASLFYELNGKHEFAAKLRCTIEEIGDLYLTDDECVLDQDLSPPEVPEPLLSELYNQSAQYSQHYETEEQHGDELELVQMQQVSLVERINAIVAQLEEPEPQPEPIIVQQEPVYSDEQFDAVWAALTGDKDDE